LQILILAITFEHLNVFWWILADANVAANLASSAVQLRSLLV